MRASRKVGRTVTTRTVRFEACILIFMNKHLLFFSVVTLGMTLSGCNQISVPGGPQACTQEAKLCPDGSYVGRTGPNCEFAPCPGI